MYMPLDKNKEGSPWRYLAARLRNHILALQGVPSLCFILFACSQHQVRIEQPVVVRKGHSQLEKFIITRITSTKLNDDVSSQ